MRGIARGSIVADGVPSRESGAPVFLMNIPLIASRLEKLWSRRAVVEFPKTQKSQESQSYNFKNTLKLEELELSKWKTLRVRRVRVGLSGFQKVRRVRVRLYGFKKSQRS